MPEQHSRGPRPGCAPARPVGAGPGHCGDTSHRVLHHSTCSWDVATASGTTGTVTASQRGNAVPTRVEALRLRDLTRWPAATQLVADGGLKSWRRAAKTVPLTTTRTPPCWPSRSRRADSAGRTLPTEGADVRRWTDSRPRPARRCNTAAPGARRRVRVGRGPRAPGRAAPPGRRPRWRPRERGARSPCGPPRATRRRGPASCVHTEHVGLQHPYGPVPAPARPGGQHGNAPEGHGLTSCDGT